MGLLGAAIVLVVSCRGATEIFVEARTNLAYRDGLVTTFTVGAPAETEGLAPTTESREPWSVDGFVGSLAVVPNSGSDGRVSVKVVLGIDRAASTCQPPSYTGCIVARRTLSYAPHERLRLPISLYAACKDVPCDAASTCNVLGQCVSAAVDPATCSGPSGCTTPGDPSLPIGTDASADAPSEDALAHDAAAGDAANDAPTDTADASANDGGSTPPTPGWVDCKDVSCNLQLGETCCYSELGGGTGTCLAPGSNCPVVGSVSLISCDGAEDCSLGSSCCFVGSSGAGTRCSVGGCDPYPFVCHSTHTCAMGKCTGLGLGYYRTCQP
jgi:hypothetical protein